ncbi:cyclase family protein [Candidatus Micrarchaeota archaeon]|nr:cyclase family protein [Candidatus Micrarchaeota archaeon]
MKKLKAFDCSIEIKNGMMVYPGNPQTKIELKKEANSLEPSMFQVTIGSHTGTHIDSPRHIKKFKASTEKTPITTMFGLCRVIDLTKVEQKVSVTNLEKLNIKKDEIILFKTKNSQRVHKKFFKDFIYVDESAAKFLAKKKIKTLCVDSLGVQSFHSRNQKVHEIILENGITLFEGVDLRKIKPGVYFFIGLPIKIQTDGAPARVILCEVNLIKKLVKL